MEAKPEALEFLNILAVRLLGAGNGGAALVFHGLLVPPPPNLRL